MNSDQDVAPATADMTDNLEGVAIIGMAGRFPGASDVGAFWRNICAGVDSASRFDAGELEDSFTAEERAQSDFVAVRPVLDDVDQFDAHLFRMRPREASLTDPQHRIFLEISWSAIEDAGYDPQALAGRAVGVFAGCSHNTYLLRHVCGDRTAAERFTNDFQVGGYEALTGAIADALATRVSYKLDLRGPSMTIATACSTSLTAVAQAVQSLLLFQCDMALAGGVSVTFPQKRGYFSQDGGMVSTDGVCRPFDAGANGTLFGSGAGVVLLKRLEDAVADGDPIYAVIRGVAVNNDGASKVGFTAPSVDAQAEVVATAQLIAGFDPATVGYVECHGTATPLGDPIEVAALARAFGAGGGAGRTWLGSVKGNVGHLDAAAGVTGLIKAALAVNHGVIPPTCHFTTPNPRLELEKTPFAIAGGLVDWREPDGARRAGVSALGVGGVNVHVCLEQAPQRPSLATGEAARAVLMLSARSEDGLKRARAGLATALRHAPATALGDVAHTLATGRGAFAHRAAIVADSVATAIDRLEAGEGAGIVVGEAAVADRPVIFMFPGQGAQYPAMGLGLYEREPVFRDAVDRCAGILKPSLGLDLRQPLYGPEARDGDGAETIRQTILAQPAIFTVEYALAQLWLSRGVRPAAMIGHSIGEFVAATLAGVLTLEEALGLVAVRGRLMQAVAAGAMLAVRLPEAEVRAVLPEGVDIAAVNAPGLTVAAGPFEAIEQLENTLAGMGAMHRRLHTSHAFHSAMMEPVLADLAVEAARVRPGSATIPYVSCVTGDWITEAETGASDYWARHCRAAVRFSDGVATLLQRFETPVLLEVGPGSTLLTLCRQGAGKGRSVATVASLPDPGADQVDMDTFYGALGQLWRHGAAFDRASACPGQRVSLPGVPFERQRYWVAAPASTAPASTAPAVTAAAEPANATQAAPLPSPAPMQADPVQMNTHTPVVSVGNTGAGLASKVAGLFEELSGESIAEADFGSPFLELGFDSLFLAQVATQVQKTFKVKVTFRQLLNDMPSIARLADFLADKVPAPAAAVPAQAAPAPAQAQAVFQIAAPAPAPAAPVLPAPQMAGGVGVEGLFRDQLAALQGLIAQQNQILLGQASIAPGPLVSAATAPAAPQAIATQPAAAPSAAAPVAPAATAAQPAAAAEDAGGSRHQLYRPGGASTAGDITAAQATFLADLIARYTARTPGSKRMTDARRDVLADPRTAAGFRPEWKEMVYPIVCSRSKGSRIWDVDGNEYIDVVNGYGQTAFGHAPDFVLEAMQRQMRDGFAIGPQSPLAGEVAELFAEMTGNERVTFCNTGSEAVMAAMRVARAVTGRDRIVVFNGGYHGQFDEVLVKGKARQDDDPRGLPIAPGIPFGSVGNMVVLPWAKPESLDWIRAHGDDIAAVIAEPVQSRHPDVQPAEFLRDLRAITEAAGSALVFDEVVTGFRVHPGGMQAVFGVRADMATYGKVVGGGMPVGVLAGKRSFMDALDGGAWRYGDDSVPEVAPTFFAGTFVRHPMVMAAAKAVLLHLKEQGPALQEQLAARAQGLADRINAELARRGIGARAESYSSWFYLALGGEDRLASLFYHHMRLLGVHWQEGFPCYFTTEHSDADMAFIYDAFVKTLDALQGAGILTGSGVAASAAAPATASVSASVSAPVSWPMSSPLTEPQIEVWLAAQLGDEASCAFNESISLDLSGPLDREALQQALDAVVARHDALRARFAPDGSQMFIDAPAAAPLAERDFSANPAALAELKDDEARTPFDLVNGPLMRATLVRLSPSEHVLVFTAHHIVCDGWSTNVILDEMAQVYQARRTGRQADLPAPLPFRSYALEQTTAVNPATRDWWMAQFRALPPDADLPADRPRGDVKDWSGDTYCAHIPGDLLRQVKQAGAKQGATLFSTLAAAFNVVLWRLTGETDQVMAIPTAGQSLTEGGPLVGHCVNFLPLRARIDPEEPVSALLKTVQKAMLDMNEHQDYTFGALVRELGVARNPSRLPLTQVQFNLERVGEGLDFGEVTASVATNAKAFVNFDIFLNIIEGADGLRLACDYSTGLYDATTIARWIGHFEQALRAIVADAAQPAKALRLMDAATVDQLVNGLNATARDGLDLRPVPLQVADMAARHPDAIALIWRDQIMTYGQLDAATGALAARVAAVAPGGGGRVGVLVERSPAMVVAMLAAMRAGHAFTPLDPAHPETRLQQVVDAARICALVCDDPARASIAGGAPLVDVRAGAAPDASAAQLPDCADASAAYVIFTSGSTGTPKGVEIGHAALANLLWSFAERPGFTAADSMLAVTTTTFDIAMLELFMPLVTGGRVIIADRQAVQDGFALARLIAEKRPSHIQATPSLWRMLSEAGFQPWPGLTMLCGGEPLPRDLARELSGGAGALWNVYGPTETTIWSSAGEVRPDDDPITIGAPVLNTGLYVIDASGQLALPGAAGELAIGGLGLANGYFGQPDLTAAAFRPHTLEDGASRRLYFTGDMARRLPDGRIQHLGRRDLQIKLRGFRIELEDIESALRAIPGVADAAAGVVGVEPERRLAAWVVMAGGQPLDETMLREKARQALPDYMVPAIWSRLDALPLTANGKLNRKALPQPERVAAKPAARVVAPPQNATQKLLCGVWSEVLGGEAVGIDADILDLGADSIQIFQIVARARRAGVNLAARDVLRCRTIAALAEAIDTTPGDMAAAPAGPLPRLADFRRR
ncbi:amino acid adenylation domain-containing protein [Camelimonas sp. ID_303_24]